MSKKGKPLSQGANSGLHAPRSPERSLGHRRGPVATRVWDRPPRQPSGEPGAAHGERGRGRGAGHLHRPRGRHPCVPASVGLRDVPGALGGNHLWLFPAQETKQTGVGRAAHFLRTFFLLFKN